MMPLLLSKELMVIDGCWEGVIFFSDITTDLPPTLIRETLIKSNESLM